MLVFLCYLLHRSWFFGFRTLFLCLSCYFTPLWFLFLRFFSGNVDGGERIIVSCVKKNATIGRRLCIIADDTLACERLLSLGINIFIFGFLGGKASNQIVLIITPRYPLVVSSASPGLAWSFPDLISGSILDSILDPKFFCTDCSALRPIARPHSTICMR